MWATIKATFTEADGSLALPEIHTAAVALVTLCAAVRDCFIRGGDFPYVTVCASVGSLVLAYGIADRIRKGVWKPGEGKVEL